MRRSLAGRYMPARLFCILGKFDFNIVIEASRKAKNFPGKLKLRFAAKPIFLWVLLLALKENGYIRVKYQEMKG